MRNFYAAMSDPNSFISDAGSRYHVERSGFLDSAGVVSLRSVGKIDVQEKINSYRQSTDMAYILSRLSSGDTSVLRDGAMYGDFTSLPRTMSEAYQLVIDGERKFDMLPEPVRAKFGFDFRRWFSSAGSADWFSSMGFRPVDQQPVQQSVKEVNAVEP